ncbi:MAG: M20/M25/M40 family metallo-hydrolase [Actinomycetota bacterium]|nr:M20/M25/M40 family metallo-hydrolase [Actinomycetota bacterium]
MKNKFKNIINSHIDKNKDWLIKNIFKVVSKNTINTPPSGNENNGQEVIEKILKDLGLQIDRFSPDNLSGLKDKSYYLKDRTYNNRDNIVGYTGEGKKFTLIFNGHIDTVPSNHFKWQKTEPFEPKVIDDRIYGLGVCDMKSGIICSIFALKAILDLGFKIKGKVIIESVVDEEFGGANGSLACVFKGYTGDMAIITEPTSMKVGVSNVCSKVLLLKIKGAGGLNYFGKSIDNINPIILMSEVLLMIKKYEDYLNSIKHKYPIYRDMKTPFNFLFSDIEAGKIGPDKIMSTRISVWPGYI